MYKLFVKAHQDIVKNLLKFRKELQILGLDYGKFVIPRGWICSVAESKFYKTFTDFCKRVRTEIKKW